MKIQDNYMQKRRILQAPFFFPGVSGAASPGMG